jgi:hypothetical protein
MLLSSATFILFVHDYRITNFDRVEVPLCVGGAQADTAMAGILDSQ